MVANCTNMTVKDTLDEHMTTNPVAGKERTQIGSKDVGYKATITQIVHSLIWIRQLNGKKDISLISRDCGNTTQREEGVREIWHSSS